MSEAAWSPKAGVIAGALLLDAVLGDPPWLPHPVRGIGWIVEAGKRRLWTGRRAADSVRGAGLAILTVVLAVVAGWTVGEVAKTLGGSGGEVVAGAAVGWTAVALRGLVEAAERVRAALERGDLAGARAALPALVGRDPQELDAEDIARAAIESVAENLSDAVVAPLFWLGLFGPAGALGYRAINTLDSMIGYRDAEHLHFGAFAARLDDGANWIPARIATACLVAAAFPAGRAAAAWQAARRYGHLHPSPNAGLLEAAMAGALGLRLGGPARYGGELEERPFLGGGSLDARPGHIGAAVRLVVAASLASVPAVVGLQAVLAGVAQSVGSGVLR